MLKKNFPKARKKQKKQYAEDVSIVIDILFLFCNTIFIWLKKIRKVMDMANGLSGNGFFFMLLLVASSTDLSTTLFLQKEADTPIRPLETTVKARLLITTINRSYIALKLF